MNFNKDWRFKLEDITSGHLMDLDESNFSIVNLPHDYSMLQPYDAEHGTGNTAYKPGGIAWYRKTFTTTDAMKQGKVYLEFDGIYNRASIYCNEKFLKFHPYGYAPCLLDITDYLNDETNVIAVHVDHSRYSDSRWYTGSGIYRKVALHVLPKQHFGVYGIQISTPEVSATTATVQLKTQIEGNSPALSIATKIFAPDGSLVAEGMTQKSTQTLKIANPALWGVYDGQRYTAELTLLKHDKAIETRTELFGIRSFYFDTEQGFFLNGIHTLIKGVCLHHDGGLVGAAVPKDVWRRRLNTLKECGCNAIRTAHNPFSRDFMDLCDEMGFLVQEEFYDEWDNPKDKQFNCGEKHVQYITQGHHEFFQEYAKDDLQCVIQRDFNHPCIFQWSIGNEIEWTYDKYVYATGYFDANASGNYFWTEPPYSVEEIRARVAKLPKEKYEIGETAMKLANWTRELDTTRPVIANMILPSASYESGYADALDMVGFSYRRVIYDRAHKHYPTQAIMGTENVAQWHEWNAVLDRPFVSGIYLWTGIDYLGEATADSPRGFTFPQKTSASGIMDLAGFPKVPYHLFKTLWNDTPSLYMMTKPLTESIYAKDTTGTLVTKEGHDWQTRLWRWEPRNHHWNYTNTEEIVVEAFSNAESVTLFLNDVAISTLYLADFADRIYKWVLPYADGTLKAVSSDGVTQVLVTASNAHHVALTADKETLTCDLDQVVHIEAELQDSNGNPVSFEDADVTFTVTGDAILYGVDNGSPCYAGNHQGLEVPTHQGRALLILGGKTIGAFTVHATVNDVVSNSISVQVTE